MICHCTKEEWMRLALPAWEMLKDLSQVSFPLYCDGVKTRETFFQRSQEAFMVGEEEMLLFQEQGRFAGWAHTYWLPQDRYLGLAGMAVAGDFVHGLEELLSYWSRHFTGYTWQSYFPQENRQAIRFLQSQGAQLLAQEAVGMLLLKDYTPGREDPRVIQLGKDNFSLFRQVHQPWEETMYWTSQRIEATLPRWILLGEVEEGLCRGAVYATGGKDWEIFGLDLPQGNGPAEALLTALLNRAKEEGARSVTFFHDPVLTPLVDRAGFRILTTGWAFQAPV